ncbi:nickel pincer cofactor biosynthesis protein LarC [Granulicella sp. WH15]|uniref:nickel pincer cofactor biosynthesis protein LarC n=1 Tax=Granulicella sp. WH15 TaxID=2602070 RepID=UPI001367250F|nr:nickel pincer cofactor biosynthesis protein LarC [Granulicella sp. WH15]QHN02834.1 nickel pincer cofactor biosynthesis protein LarC [Granulicella sp. WH15]
MRIAYLDCFAGISGDMFLGALLEAGVPEQVMHDAVAALNLGASLKIERVDRSGISCTKVHVLEGDELAEAKAHTHSHSHSHSHTHDGGSFEHQSEGATHTHQPQTQHLHKGGHSHDHDHNHPHEHTHEHVHGRSLTVIRELIQSTSLAGPVKATAIKAFELLGASEAKIHNVPVEQIHFHEVGAVDAIVDIVAASAGIHHLKIGAWHSSPLNVGGGMVVCAHGTFPVPAPATADLLKGYPTYSAHVQKELVTPTGAALIRALEPTFGAQPAMRVDAIGYGAGTRNPKDFPNVLRLSVGTTEGHHKHGHDASETVTVLETALDDLSPQVLAYVAETALAKGALDVMLTPVVMKKGRPGTLLTVLCNPGDRAALERLILSETSTLGVRVRQDRRVCLERSFAKVETPYGEIRMKIGSLAGEELNSAPEFEDCKAAAAAHGVALKMVQQAAIAAYRR